MAVVSVNLLPEEVGGSKPSSALEQALKFSFRVRDLHSASKLRPGFNLRSLIGLVEANVKSLDMQKSEK